MHAPRSFTHIEDKVWTRLFVATKRAPLPATRRLPARRARRFGWWTADARERDTGPPHAA